MSPRTVRKTQKAPNRASALPWIAQTRTAHLQTVVLATNRICVARVTVRFLGCPTRWLKIGVAKSTPENDLVCVRRHNYPHRVKASDGRRPFSDDSAHWISRARGFFVVEAFHWCRSLRAPWVLTNRLRRTHQMAHSGTGSMEDPRTALHYRRRPATKHPRRQVHP